MGIELSDRLSVMAVDKFLRVGAASTEPKRFLMASSLALRGFCEFVFFVLIALDERSKRLYSRKSDREHDHKHTNVNENLGQRVTHNG